MVAASFLVENDMRAPTIDPRTPPEEVARLAKESDNIVIEGDDVFQHATLEKLEDFRSSVGRHYALLDLIRLVLDFRSWFRVVGRHSALLDLIRLFALSLLGLLLLWGLLLRFSLKQAAPIEPTEYPQSNQPIEPKGHLEHYFVWPLVWPSVVVIVATLIYLIVRQAIEAGNSVEVSWKITEKAQGRIVVRKIVKRRRARSTSAPDITAQDR